MMYLTLKLIHILSAIVLFGLGSGTVFFKVMADKSGDHAASVTVSSLCQSVVRFRCACVFRHDSYHYVDGVS